MYIYNIPVCSCIIQSTCTVVNYLLQQERKTSTMVRNKIGIPRAVWYAMCIARSRMTDEYLYCMLFKRQKHEPSVIYTYI